MNTIEGHPRGVGLELAVPNAFRFKGPLELFEDDPEFGNGSTGHIALGITPSSSTIDAQLPGRSNATASSTC